MDSVNIKENPSAPITVGENFINQNVWMHPSGAWGYILLGFDVETVDEGFKKKGISLPMYLNKGTHYVILVKSKFLNVIKKLDDHCRLCYALNQILPWDMVEKLIPFSYKQWKEKIYKKAAATALNERNRLARLERKEIAQMLSNKSVSQFTREQRELGREGES